MESRDQGLGAADSGSGVGCSDLRKRILLACLVGISVTPAMAKGDNVNEGQMSIDVRVYNYARVADGRLTQAERGAAEVFRAAEVGITWVNCQLPQDSRCSSPLDPTHVGVRILTDLGLTPSTTNRTMGYAVGDLASLSLRRVQADAAEFRVALESVLSPALAHEIGHLLLASQGHSSSGIMRARWRREDYERAPRGALRFTSRQAETIRTEIRRRTQNQTATESAATTRANGKVH